MCICEASWVFAYKEVFSSKKTYFLFLETCSLLTYLYFVPNFDKDKAFGLTIATEQTPQNLEV